MGANNFCGDVAYLSTLLTVLGFSETHMMTMTNKIKDVELVWTLGAMLAKSAELANDHGNAAGFGSVGLLLVLAAALVYYFGRRGRYGKGPGYRHVSLPPGH